MLCNLETGSTTGEIQMIPIDSITAGIIGDAIEVHRELGPGLLESTYEACLVALLSERGWTVGRQVTRPVVFRGKQLDLSYRLDLLVEDRVIVVVKTIKTLEPVHFAQMMTYLKLSGCEVGLLINFNVPRLVDGLRRVIRSTSASSAPPPSSAIESR